MLYVTGTARVVKNGTLSLTKNGKEQGVVRVAFSRTFKDGAGEVVEDTSFVDLIAWGRTGVALASRIAGEQIGVQGRLNVKTNQANGTTYTNVSVVVNEVNYLTTKAQREALLAKSSPNAEVREDVDIETGEMVAALQGDDDE